MEFDKVKIGIKHVGPDMTRNDNEDYFEAVIKKARLEEVMHILENNFGPPAWPSRVKLPKEAEAVANNFGGLRKGQTLYFSIDAGCSVFAMLWPWQDNERVTIKMGRV